MSQHKTKALLFAGQNNTDPQREKEFNEWYDRVHAYDSLDTPGITAYQRYRNVDPQPGEPSYLSMSELDTETSPRCRIDVGRSWPRRPSRVTQPALRA